MDLEAQKRAPIYEALERFRKKRVVPFDVPGHKRGRGNPELAALLGEKCVGLDVNSMKPLDNLCHPVSVIREAEELAADAFGAAHAFLMVGGTTSSVQTMVLTACKRGDEIILPRNVHRSVLNALVLCGAIPVYVNPEVDQRLGISLGMRREQVAKAIKEHPNAVDVLVNNACISRRGILSGCSYEEFNKVLCVGVSAPYLLSSLFLEHFSRGASIVNIASSRAFMSQKDTESYSAAKGGILALTHALAMSLAPRGVRAADPGALVSPPHRKNAV